MKNELKAELNAVLLSAVDRKQVSGASVFVAQRGEELCYLEAGYQDISAKMPVRRDTIFRLYSMSKPVTAVAAMMLIERGEMCMKDPVAKYLPAFEGYKTEQPMTVFHLMRMTSGLSYDDVASETERQTKAIFDRAIRSLSTDSPMTTLEFAELIAKVPPLFEPGTQWKYGVSADIMGAVIEAVSGKTFGTFLKDEIFDPLGMVDTGFHVPDEKRHRLAKVYEPGADGELVEYTGSHLGIRHLMDREARFESGGAGLASTVDDYAMFAQMLLNRGSLDGVSILRPNTVEYLTTAKLLPNQQQYFDQGIGMGGNSYGNFMRVLWNPEQAVTLGRRMEYGWGGWLGTYFMNCPEQQLTLIVMLQKKDGSDLVDRLRNVLFSHNI